MLSSMHINIELFVLLKCEDLNFKLQSSESPLLCGDFSEPRVGSQYLLYAALNTPAQNPKIGLNLEHLIDKTTFLSHPFCA